MKLNNNIHIFQQYIKAYAINDEIIVFMSIQHSVEQFFQKQVYFDEELNIRFSENDKIISFSPKLSTSIIKNLKKEINRVLANSKLDLYFYINKIVEAQVIKKSENGYWLAILDNNNAKCFFSTDKHYNIGEKDLFFVYKIENNILRLRIDFNVSNYILNLLTNYEYFIVTERWIQNKIIVFTYTAQAKLGKATLNKIMTYFQNEKIIFNKR